MRNLGRLLRLSLAPSAAADVAAGVVLGSGGLWPAGGRPFYLILASLGIYHGAMALNDWADRREDARTRPERPIPSGDIPAPAALAIAMALMIGGVACAALADPRAALWMGGVGLLAAFYDVAGRGPWIGPSLLGLCRAANFGAGLVFAALWTGQTALLRTGLLPAVLYGLYVFIVSRLGRLEDGEDGEPLGKRPQRLLFAAAGCLALVPAAGLLPFGRGLGAALSLAVAGGGALGLARAGLRKEPWTRPAVLGAMGLCLRRLLVFTAAATLLAYPASNAPLLVAGAILAGYPLAFALRRVFPPS